MANTYRIPKDVQQETESNTTELGLAVRSAEPLSFSQVVEMRASWQGLAGQEWSGKIIAEAQKETPMQKRDMAGELPDLPEELTELLADTITFYLRAHGAHWNVVGTDFAEYHKLFADIYEDVYGSVDPIAENLRKLGSFAPFQLPALVGLRSLADTNVGTDARALATDLLAANDVLIEEISETFNCATAHGQQGIANFLADRLDRHQMWKWQLSASLGVESDGTDLSSEVETIEEPGEAVVEVPVEGELLPRSANDIVEERKSAIASAERLTMTAEVRAMTTTDGSLRIGGYAAQFGQEATGLSFREVIAPGAFKRSLAAAEPVFLLVNHDTDSLPLASTQGGTLSLSEDAVGLRMEADLDPKNPRAQELVSALSRGDVDKMSFAFTVAPGGEVRDAGVRTLTDLNLFEVSVVTWPAYDSTTVGMRSASDEDLQLRKRKIALSLKLHNLR